jgi:hypothetical protein
MATSDIAKMSVFDPRIIQQAPAFAVNKGALSLTNVPFTAISQTTSQHTYNCPIPSQNVFVDRAIDWTNQLYLNVDVVSTNVSVPVGNSYLDFGKDCALTNFPLHSLIQTMTATINDTTVTMNTSDVLKEVLRLTSTRGNKLSRTCPTMDDNSVLYSDLALTAASPLASYGERKTESDVPNGAFPGVLFCSPVAPFTIYQPGANVNNAYLDPVSGQQISIVNGVPVKPASPAADNVRVGIVVSSIEKLVLSPFIFANQHEWDTGLFGINAIQFVMNLGSPARILRGTQTLNGAVRSFTTSYGSQGFQNSQLLVQILTPSLDVPLPPKSVVPYMEFPRYISSLTPSPNPWLKNTSQTFSSQTIVLPQIPDMLLIYAKPATYASPNVADFHYVPENISLNFDNFAGLLSAHRQPQLYQMAVHNGLEMDYAQWVGNGYVGSGGVVGGSSLPTVGGFLVLRPGVDFALQSGQAPGLAGNFVLQYNITLRNQGPDHDGAIQLFTVAVNAGFFESMAGSSRVVKAVVSEADIISAEPAPIGSHDEARRLVGAGWMDTLGSFFHRALSAYRTSKPYVSMAKSLLPESGMLGKLKTGLSAVGYGSTGGKMNGCGPGSTGGRKKGLSERLM